MKGLAKEHIYTTQTQTTVWDYWREGGRWRWVEAGKGGGNWEICNNVNNKLIKKTKKNGSCGEEPGFTFSS